MESIKEKVIENKIALISVAAVAVAGFGILRLYLMTKN